MEDRAAHYEINVQKDIHSFGTDMSTLNYTVVYKNRQERFESYLLLTPNCGTAA